MMKFLLREPLVHFGLIGIALFFAFSFAGNPVNPESDRIVVTQGQTDFLKANFTRTWQRPPTEEEMQGLINGYVRDEILYREALALGLDRDDPVIRRRLKQKLEFMNDDLAGVVTASDEQLKEFISSHPESFRIEAQVTFRHIFLGMDQHGNSVMEKAAQLLTELSNDANIRDPDTMGDNLMLPKSFNLSPVSEIARLFGKLFSVEIMKIKQGNWTGPIRSGYGLHLVLISEKIEERQPELDEVREIVEREWLNVHKTQTRESLYNNLRKKYTVAVETEAGDEKPFSIPKEAQAGGERRP